MVTKKLTAIWRIIRSTEFFAATVQTKGNLEGAVRLSLQVRGGYQALLDSINSMALENGDLHELERVKKLIEEENGRD